MYYKLKENYALRGWDEIPFCILDVSTGNMECLDEFIFSILSLCNGKVNSTMMLPQHMEVIDILEKQKIIEHSPIQTNLKEFQKYKRATCKYIETAHWSITGKCNLKCRHCYMSAPQAKYGELTLEQCFNIIEQLEQANIYKVSLTGGEPLVRKDFWDIVERLQKKKIHISQIYTNGILVNEEFILTLKRYNLNPEISISFDGVGFHDWIRKMDKAEEKVIVAMKLLVENGFYVSVEMSLNKKNIHTLSESIFLLAKLGVASVKATPTSNSGNWLSENKNYSLSTSELYEAYLHFISEYKEAGAPIDVMLGGFFACRKGSMHYSHPSKKYDGSEEMLQQVVCGSARANMYISADGKLLPCIPLSGLPIQETMPSILNIPLIDALSDSVYLKAITNTLQDLIDENEECNSCDQKMFCGGGCRASALICGNSYLGKDEATCYFFKNGYEKKIREIYMN